MVTETLVLHSGQKFMCFAVHFHEKFLFWYQTGIVPENVYAAIRPVLEALKSHIVLTLSYVRGGSDNPPSHISGWHYHRDRAKVLKT